MSETTDNYSFVTGKLGHPVRDTRIGDNLDLIDAAIKVQEDAIDVLEGVNAGGALASAKIIVGDNGGVVGHVDMSGDITIDNLGETSIGADKVTKTEIDVDIAGSGISQAVGGELDRDAIVLKGIVTVPLSFETNELTSTKIYFPFAATITKICSIVMLAIEATSDGTITGNNGSDSSGVVTVEKGAALNVEDSADPVDNNTVAAGEYYMLTTAKADAGGKVLVTLEYTQSI